MLGAFKLTVEQVRAMKDLFNQNLSDAEIAGMYGVSRPYVNMIRNGYRWPNEREKVKSQIEEVEDLPCICDTINLVHGNYSITSRVCPVVTPNGKVYIILHYLGDKLTGERFTKLFDTIPTLEVLKINHDKFKNKIW